MFSKFLGALGSPKLVQKPSRPFMGTVPMPGYMGPTFLNSGYHHWLKNGSSAIIWRTSATLLGSLMLTNPPSATKPPAAARGGGASLSIMRNWTRSFDTFSLSTMFRKRMCRRLTTSAALLPHEMMMLGRIAIVLHSFS